MPRCFLDANVLFYACDTTDASKQQTAKELILDASLKCEGVVSVQVLGEFFNATVHGKNRFLTPDEAERLIHDYAKLLEVVTVDWIALPKAIAIHRTYQTKIFDSLHLAVAGQCECMEFLSEDLTDGQLYDGVRVRNPFRAAP